MSNSQIQIQTFFTLLGAFSKELSLLCGDAFNDFGRNQLRDMVGEMLIDAGARIKTIDVSKKTITSKFPSDEVLVKSFYEKLSLIQDFLEKINNTKEETVNQENCSCDNNSPNIVELCNNIWKSLTEEQLIGFRNISPEMFDRIQSLLTEPDENVLLTNFVNFKKIVTPHDIGIMHEMTRIMTKEQEEMFKLLLNRIADA